MELFFINSLKFIKKLKNNFIRNKFFKVKPPVLVVCATIL